MTLTEIRFLQGVLESGDLNESDLTQMSKTLRCDQLFFSVPPSNGSDNDHDNDNISNNAKEGEEQEPERESNNCTFNDNDNTSIKSEMSVGSKKRQAYLEARKNQAAEQCKKRAALLWKKTSVAALATARLQVTTTTSSSSTIIRKRLSQEKRPSTLSTQPTVNEEKSEDDDSNSDKEEYEDLDKEKEDQQIQPDTNKSRGKAVFLKRASVNVYGGEGFEICGDFLEENKPFSYDDDDNNDDGDGDDGNDTDADNDEEEDRTGGETESNIQALRDSSDLQQNPLPPTTNPRPGMGLRQASINIYGGSGFEVAETDLFDEIYEQDGSHKTEEHYDPWLYQEFDEHGRKRKDLTILGTSHDDVDCHPHVLSPIQMEVLQPFLPESKRGQSFWLKYSLVRDGSSPISFLQQVRASPCTLLVMETVDREVFGGFFSRPWTIQPGYFGTGESFLWRMKHRRHFPGDYSNSDSSSSSSSLAEQIEREADLEVFQSEIHYANDFFQLCTRDRIGAGGGATSIPQDFGPGRGGIHAPQDIGFGLVLGCGGGSSFGSSLLDCSSSACMTYKSPPLSQCHADGSKFELVNLEAWGFTPCQTEEEARLLEYKKMFLQRNASSPL